MDLVLFFYDCIVGFSTSEKVWRGGSMILYILAAGQILKILKIDILHHLGCVYRHIERPEDAVFLKLGNK